MKNLLDHVASIDRVKVGVPVFHNRHGWGKVVEINAGTYTPIVVTFHKMQQFSYTLAGKLANDDVYPSLFLIDIFNGTQPPEPEIDWEKVPMGTAIECSNTPSFQETWYGKLICYDTMFPSSPFIIREPADCVESFKYARLAPSVTVKPEWLRAGG